MRNIEKFYRPQDYSKSGQPIRVEVVDNTIRIQAVFQYNKAALKPWDIDGMSQADIIEAGIIRNWSGQYRLRSPKYKGYIKAKVIVEIKRKIVPDSFDEIVLDPLARKRQRAVSVRVRRLHIMPAHVISPWYRRIWGIFRTGQWESLGTNWGRRHPGIMVLPPCAVRSVAWYERLAAHEAGHLFGLGDAYGAIYRYYYSAPFTSKYIMNSNRKVQAKEIIMLLEAHMNGKMQFFPKKWDRKVFVRGFKREVDRRTRELERRKKSKQALRKKKSVQK